MSYDPSKPITATNWPPSLRMPPLRREPVPTRSAKAASQKVGKPTIAADKALEKPAPIAADEEDPDEFVASILAGPARSSFSFFD